MVRKIPVVAIVGRTNVGKSTLFNALARRRLAVVEDTPGVTRDRHYALIKGYGSPFTLIDTGGLVGEDEQGELAKIRKSVRAQTDIAIKECDLALVVFDGIAGPHSLDYEVVDELRRAGKSVLWVVNKCERPLNEVLAAEFYALGINEYVCVSAAHRLGVKELGAAISARVGGSITADGVEDDLRGIRVAVLGRPNVGKSSLINRILGEERLIASDVPGTTRDSIDVELTREGRDFVLVDTAGLRKRSKVDAGTIERFSNLRTLRTLAGCDVAVLVLDATQGAPSDQERRIAELIHERGRGFIIAVNKWDAVEKDHRTVHDFKELVYRELGFVRYAPILFISALSGRRCPLVLREAAQIFDEARKRIQTSKLNDVLQRIFRLRPPPVVRGDAVKLFFATQVSVAPPTILMFMNHPQELKPSYLRYVKAHLRKEFAFPGVDIKLEPRKRTEKQAHMRSQKQTDALPDEHDSEELGIEDFDSTLADEDLEVVDQGL